MVRIVPTGASTVAAGADYCSSGKKALLVQGL